ncbi:predicted protein [Naegleria gruberi]|uniref:Predicted protein n=1 Tax=Naegleria gruberi TaxID=5762 RepID=D2W635_NAEGR|nr:uncharacterized protein NAEGRDRAFT_54897 [Naegleria gruberi]EFC35468.1 predicted protein [Naegleria gruberi]|eukprot:XP_002668212.1 predicted protein [Naegleria gruberi strain NEG-M]
MKDLHHIMKDMNNIGDERENASEEWWNSLALNIPGPSESSISSSPKQSSNTNNNTSISSNNSNTNEGLKINMSLIKAFNDSGTSENLNLNNSNDNINNSSKRDDDSDDEDDEENEDELLTLSSLAKLRKLIPRIPKLIPPDENGAERSSTLNMLNLTSPKKSSNNSRGIVSLTSETENLLKSPKQQLDSKRTDLSILLDNEPGDHFNVFSLSNSPKKSTTSKRNFDNTLETLSKVYSPKQNNINLETITIPKKEYEDLKTDNVILQGRLIQMELIHEKLLQMILNNKSN